MIRHAYGVVKRRRYTFQKEQKGRCGFRENLVIIKRILNIDGPKIDLVTQGSEYYPSDLIKGEVLITAPDYRKKVKAITLTLEEFWVGYRRYSSRYLKHVNITLASRFVFDPEMQYHFPFEVQLPKNCRVSSEESGWRLGVIIYAFGLSVFRADFDIHVRLSKLLQRIIESIERNTKSAEVLRGRKYDSYTSKSIFIFRPPDHLKSELQYFELNISFPDEAGIKVDILINWKNAQKTYSHNFDIKPIQSIDSKGQDDIVGITEFISDTLTEAMSSKKYS